MGRALNTAELSPIKYVLSLFSLLRFRSLPRDRERDRQFLEVALRISSNIVFDGDLTIHRDLLPGFGKVFDGFLNFHG